MFGSNMPTWDLCTCALSYSCVMFNESWCLSHQWSNGCFCCCCCSRFPQIYHF